MFLHHNRMMDDVRLIRAACVSRRRFVKQLGVAIGELAAATRYFTQGWNEPDERRRSMLLDIATRL